jgi:hypothetical protein
MRAHGIDFSKWAADWVLPETTQLDFAIQRLGYGLKYDECYENHGNRMGQVGIRGGYWYYYEKYKWAEQVDLFLQATADHPYKLHKLWWDVEGGYNDFSNRQRIANETAEAIDRLRENFDGVVGLYTNLNIYCNYLQPFLPLTWLEDVPLWLAYPIEGKELKYFRGNVEPYWGKMKRKPGNWFMWQVSFLGDPEFYGIKDKKAVDVDVFNGDRKSMEKALGISWWEKLRRHEGWLNRLEKLLGDIR